MTMLTQKQAAFVANKVAGLTNEASAIAAGYSPASARQQATLLMKHEGVKRAIVKGKREAKVDAGARKSANALADQVQDEADPEVAGGVLADSYPTPLDFMLACMNNPKLPPGLRFEGAKQALPYVHGKVGEKGKKASAVDRAREHTGEAESGNERKPRTSFSPMQSPSRNKVN